MICRYETLRFGRQRSNLTKAKCYEEWAVAAQQLDCGHGKDSWRDESCPPLYDASLISRLSDALAERDTHDGLLENEASASSFLRALHTACKADVGGVHSEQIYAHCYFGTKRAVQAFINETVSSVDWLSSKITTGLLSPEQHDITNWCERAIHSYGRTALCLSGGGAMVNHCVQAR